MDLPEKSSMTLTLEEKKTLDKASNGALNSSAFSSNSFLIYEIPAQMGRRMMLGMKLILVMEVFRFSRLMQSRVL